MNGGYQILDKELFELVLKAYFVGIQYFDYVGAYDKMKKYAELGKPLVAVGSYGPATFAGWAQIVLSEISVTISIVGMNEASLLAFSMVSRPSNPDRVLVYIPQE